MSKEQPAPSSAGDDHDTEIATLSFGLHPGRTLRVSLHSNVTETDARDLAQRAIKYTACYGCTSSATSTDDSSAAGRGTRPGRFAIMDAARIASLSHVGVAANAALGRCARWDRDAERADAETAAAGAAGGNNDTGGGGSSRGSSSSRNRRGIGQELVVCAAGTSHAGYAVRDYGFQPEAAAGGDNASNNNKSNKKRKKQQQNQPTTPATTSTCTSNAGGTTAHTILAIGFDCKNDREYQTFLSDVGLSIYPSSNSVSMEEYFHRERSEQELGRLMKAYKISQSEIDMDGSSLENAVLTRVATKFAV